MCSCELSVVWIEFQSPERTIKVFRNYLQKSARLIGFYRMFGDKQAQADIAAHRQELDDIRKALAMDDDGRILQSKSVNDILACRC